MLPIVIGGGKLYLNNAFVGDVSRFSIAPKIEVARKNDYSTGIRRTGKAVISYLGFSGSFLTDYITAANIDVYLSGLTLASLYFEGEMPRGPGPTYTLTDVTITPTGETEPMGEEWQTLGFTFEGTLTMPEVDFPFGWPGATV